MYLDGWYLVCHVASSLNICMLRFNVHVALLACQELDDFFPVILEKATQEGERSPRHESPFGY
jgi:hypothetical protein